MSKLIRKKQMAKTLLFAMAFGVNIAGHSAQLTLSETALEVTNSVEPNVMLLVDDSGSMALGLTLRDGADGALGIGNANSAGFIKTLFPEWVWIPSTTLATAHATVEDEILCQGYNLLAYDPSRTYKVWGGIDSAGDAYTDADLSNARFDPYDASGYTKNVTALNPWYYVWNDNDNDNEYDAGECTTQVYYSSLGATEKQNFANWYQYYRNRAHVMKAALSQLMVDVTGVRMGYAVYGDTSNRGTNASYKSTVQLPVASMNVSTSTGNKLALMQSIFKTQNYWRAPLHHYNTIYSTNYFNSAFNGGTPTSIRTNQTARYMACLGSDIFGNVGTLTPGSANCPVLSATDGGQCQQNYLIVITDGANDQPYTDATNHDGDSDSNFDGGAFTDSYNSSLADIAMNYYETDLFTTLTNNVPSTTLDRERYPDANGYPTDTDGDYEDMHQHISTYSISFGLNGTLSSMPTDPTAAFPWTNHAAGNSEKIDDIRHAAYNGRGEYLDAADSETLVSSLLDTFESIRTESLTSSAVSFNSSSLKSDSTVYRAYYNTLTNTGELEAFSFDTSGNIGNTAIWSASTQLDNIAPADRVIATYDGSDGIPFTWSDIGSTKQGYLNSIDTPVPTSGATVGENRLDYLRGDSSNEGNDFNNDKFRSRLTAKGRLGDIVHSSPVYVGQPPFTSRNAAEYPLSSGDEYATFKADNEDRDAVIYLGANDGMLHGFLAETGAELFAYVPSELFYQSYDSTNYRLSELTRDSYSHLAYVDLTPTINDVYIDTEDGTNSSGSSKKWHTVLLGGLRKGGKGYFALNVSDPTELDTAAEVAENVLWEFNSSDDDRLGYTYSLPALSMSNVEEGDGSNASKRWVAIWGNGYNNTNANGKAALFVAFIEDGQDGTWSEGSGDYFVLEVGDAIAVADDPSTPTKFENIPNGLSGIRPVDIDNNGTVDYVYAGDLHGNLWRFDLSSDSTNNWAADSTPIFTATYTAGGAVQTQPITNAPLVLEHPNGIDDGVVVVVGTGMWMASGDTTSTEVQSLYGLWDDPTDNNWTVLNTDLIEQEYVEQATQVEGLAVRTLTSNAVDWSTDKGWHIDFDLTDVDGNSLHGERAVRNLQYRNGAAFVNTILPNTATACVVPPGGWQLTFDPYTGATFNDPIFDINGDGLFDEDDMVAVSGANNVVAGIRFDGGTPTDSSIIGDWRVTQTSDTEISKIQINSNASGSPADDASMGRLSWKEFYVTD